jgi:hypothetical protein
MAALPLGNGLRRPLCHDAASIDATLGAQVDDPVSGEHHVGMVLDDRYGVATLD